MVENEKIKLQKKNIPLVSIVIPVYNDEKYIAHCLGSIKKQTVDFWEVWIIDDCSDDNSAKIAEIYCNGDWRFHLIKNEVNSSAWVGRAKGILASSDTVKYIMFVDADDSLVPYAVERAFTLMEEDPVDILHFGTNIKNCSNDYTNYLQPPLETLYGREIFDSFVSRNFEGHLWNKMFYAPLLRDTVKHIGVNLYLPKAQDKVLYWAVCWQKDNLKYRGVSDKLYNYNYGQGVEGSHEKITLEQYRQYLFQANAENVISQIMDEHGKERITYENVIEQSRYNLVRHSVKNWIRTIDSVKLDAINEAAKFWNKPLDHVRLSCALAEYTWKNGIFVSKLARQTEMFITSKKSCDFKVIGTYYHRMDNGGIQRVIAQLVKYWHEMGYEVVVFNDYDSNVNDYELPEYITRVKIACPISKCEGINYVERGISLAKLIQEYHVDCMVYHSYFSDVLLYDMLICKSMDVPFVLYYHNVFTRFLRYNDTRFSSVPYYSKLADAVVCLDKTSENWWRCFNGNVHTVLNPLTFDLKTTPVSARNNHNILFLGRLVEEAKHPMDSIEIAAKVIKRVPDTKMYIVGTGEEKYLEQINKRIVELGMQDGIIMCGFTNDVAEYYLNSSVFLCCSSHEGFPMTLLESTSFGLPVVMYELPYLTITEGNNGIISVLQRDVEAAAEEICRLFENQDELIRKGNAARSYLQEMYQENICCQWEKIFNSINNCIPNFCSEEQIRIADIIIREYMDGAVIAAQKDERLQYVESKLEWNRAELKKKEKELESRNYNVNMRFSNLSVVQDTIRNEFYDCKKEIEKVNESLKYTSIEGKQYLEEIYAIRASLSYKLGLFITWLPRKIRELLRKL